MSDVWSSGQALQLCFVGLIIHRSSGGLLLSISLLWLNQERKHAQGCYRNYNFTTDFKGHRKLISFGVQSDFGM